MHFVDCNNQLRCRFCSESKSGSKIIFRLKNLSAISEKISIKLHFSFLFILLPKNSIFNLQPTNSTIKCLIFRSCFIFNQRKRSQRKLHFANCAPSPYSAKTLPSPFISKLAIANCYKQTDPTAERCFASG